MAALLRFSHATIVAYLALFVALGGTTYAATSLPANSVGTKQLVSGSVTNAKLHNKAVTGAKVADHSLTGTQIDVTTIGTVPNANQLAGAPASSYRAHCPTGLVKAPNEGLCFDANERQPASWTAALSTCAQAGLQLPSAGELAQAFDDLGAGQDYQWTSAAHYQASATTFFALTLANNSSRVILPGQNALELSSPYRCVTYASN
jgi:hypothetical protein